MSLPRVWDHDGMADTKVDKLVAWGKSLQDKLRETKEAARNKLARMDFRSQQTLHNGIASIGVTFGPPAGAYLANRFISPDHQKAVAAVGSTLAVIGAVVAVLEPEAAPYMIATGSFLTGPVTKLAGDKGAEGYQAAHST